MQISHKTFAGLLIHPLAHLIPENIKCLKISTNQILVFADVHGPQDASGSQGGGSMNDQEDLSDQSEGESYSYSAPSGEPLSRDPSEPLFDADFQVRKTSAGWLSHIV